MNTYFILLEELDSKIIGPNYPQCTGVLKGYNDKYENPLSLYFFAHQKGLQIDYIPDLGSIKIGTRTRLTDLISCPVGPGNDSVISLRFRELLKEYNTSDIQFFDCLLHQKDKSFKYSWIHYIYTLEKVVDYEKTMFSHTNEKLLDKIGMINNYQDFLNFYNNDDEYGLIKSTRTIIKHKPLDFFVIGRYNQKHYVSRELKERIVGEGFSGVRFEEANDIFFV